MSKNLLDVIECEASEDCQSSPEPDILSEGERSNSGSWEDKRRETRNRYNGNASKERSTKVQVFLLLSGSTNERDRSHHGNCVKTSTEHDRGRCHKEHRSDEGGLRDIECGPEAVLLDIVAWIRSSRAHHCADTETQTSNHENPRVCSHYSVDEAAVEHGSGRHTDEADSQTGVQECIVQVCSFEWRHAAIFARLTIEY